MTETMMEESNTTLFSCGSYYLYRTLSLYSNSWHSFSIITWDQSVSPCIPPGYSVWLLLGHKNAGHQVLMSSWCRHWELLDTHWPSKQPQRPATQSSVTRLTRPPLPVLDVLYQYNYMQRNSVQREQLGWQWLYTNHDTCQMVTTKICKNFYHYHLDATHHDNHHHSGAAHHDAIIVLTT